METGFKVCNDGIYMNMPEYGADIYKLIMPRDIFVEAFQKYITDCTEGHLEVQTIRNGQWETKVVPCMSSKVADYEPGCGIVVDPDPKISMVKYDWNTTTTTGESKNFTK